MAGGRGRRDDGVDDRLEHFRRVLRDRRRALLHQVDHITADLRRLDEEPEPELEEEAQEENISRLLSGLEARKGRDRGDRPRAHAHRGR